MKTDFNLYIRHSETMILDNFDPGILTVSFSIIKENCVFIKVNISKKLNVQPQIFCCFLIVFDQSKKYSLFRNNRIQRNIT